MTCSHFFSNSFSDSDDISSSTAELLTDCSCVLFVFSFGISSSLQFLLFFQFLEISSITKLTSCSKMRTKISKHIWNGNHGQSNECKRDPAQPIPKFSKHCTVKRGKTDANVYLNKLLAAIAEAT